MMFMYVYMTCTRIRALSDLRAAKKQHFGIHHPPAEILSDKSIILPIAMQVGSKDAVPDGMAPHLLRYFS